MQQDVVLRFTEGEDFKGTLRTFMAPADQVAFERHYQTGIGHFQDEERMEWVLWLVWRAYSREVQAAADFEGFVNNLTDFDLPDTEAQNPTETPPSA